MTDDFRSYVRRHLPPLATRPEREIEIVDELALQLEAVYEEAQRDGANVEDAWTRVRAEITDWDVLARMLSGIEIEAARPAPRALPAQPGGHPLQGIASDLRHALSGLRRSPGYTLVSIATLALSLGLGVAAFSLVDGVLVRPLPYAAPERLALLKATVPPDGQETVEITYPDALDAAASGVFASVGIVMPYAGTTSITEPPTRLEGFEVSTALFATLGVTPQLGRDFTAEDGRANSAPVAIVGDGFWRRLGSPPDIVGRPIVINDEARTIVGVAPRGFRIDLVSLPADIFLPITSTHMFADARAVRGFRVIGRLAEGMSMREAGAAVATVGARLARAHPDTNRGRTFLVRPLQEETVGVVRSQLWLVAALVVLVLLVAAVNLAGLVLARSVTRLRELSLRLALGASRWRLARESLTEAVVIAAAGAVLGTGLASLALDALRASRALVMPRLAEVAIDSRALAMLAAAALIVAVGSGLTPLVLVRRLGPAALGESRETTSRPAIRLRAALVVGQTAFAFVLLTAAALVGFSLRTVLAQPLGFETDQIVTMRIAVPATRYRTRDETTRFYTELLDSVRAHPPVQSAGLTSNLPLAGNTGSTLTVQGRQDVPMALRPEVGWGWVSPGYFEAMGMPLVAGRRFTADDLRRSPHVTIINETFARLHFPRDTPIGKRVYFGAFGPDGPPEWHEIVGVVGDVRHRRMDAPPDARAYDLFGQHWSRTVSLAVRTSANPLETAAMVRARLTERDSALAVFAVRTTADLVSQAVATRRLLLWLVTVFAVAGLLVAGVGLYATLSYIVLQRTREIGVRLALGATNAEIRRIVLRRGIAIAVGGIGLGLAGVVGMRRLLESAVVDLTASQTPALGAAGLVLLTAAMAACLIPAARATRIDPVEALRDQ